MGVNIPKSTTSLFAKIALIFFGLFLFLAVLELSLRIGGFLFFYLQEQSNKTAIFKKSTYRIMCLGESTTAAQNLFETKASYPAQLETVLNQYDLGLKFSVINKGVPATKTTAILDNLKSNLDKYDPDMVIAMIGINDSLSYLSYDDGEQYSQISRFIRSLKVYKLIRLVCLHIASKTKIIDSQPAKQKVEMKPVEGSDSSKKSIDQAYIPLGWKHWREGRYVESERLFKRALEINPLDDIAYVGLGWSYRNQGKINQSEEAFKKAIEYNPNNYRAYAGLGWIYMIKGEFVLSEEAFKHSLDISKTEEWPHLGLSRAYFSQDKYLLAKEELEEVLKINPDNDKAYGLLGVICQKLGDNEMAIEFFAKANELRSRYYTSTVKDNYIKLKKMLDERGVKLVSVQYPMLSIKPLKAIFKGIKGVIFVDNEDIFKKAVEKTSYSDYFIDAFAGDFGHCTPKGYHLLAQNIADTIVVNYFDKK